MKTTAPENPEGWKELFEQVASQPDLTNELASLTELLKLPLSCCQAVQQVLKERRWVNAERPRAYVKRAAMLQARKVHLSIPYKDDTLGCGDPHLVFTGVDSFGATPRDTEAAIRAENQKRGGMPPRSPVKGRHYTSEQIDWDGEHSLKEEMADENRPHIPAEFRVKRELFTPENGKLVSIGTFYETDWKKFGEAVGLDWWETAVLNYHAKGIGRDTAMKEQSDGASRLEIQAAWKWMTESGYQKVQNYLKQGQLEEEKLEAARFARLEALDRRDRLCRWSQGEGVQSKANQLKAAWRRSGGTNRTDLGIFLKKYRAGILEQYH